MLTYTNPILVDGSQAPGNYARRDLSLALHSYQLFGPIVYGGTLWAFPLQSTWAFPNPYQSDVSFIPSVTVYNSTDGGSTWTQQDPTNAPIWTHALQGNYYWDGTSSVVTILWVSDLRFSAGQYANLVDFDMSTGTYGTPYGNVALGRNIFQPSLYKLSSGTLRLVYQREDVDIDLTSLVNGEEVVYFIDYSSGSWGSPQLFPLQTAAFGTDGRLLSTTQDGDIIHCVYSVGTFSPGVLMPIDNNDSVYYYVAIEAGGTFSSTLNIDTYQSTYGAVGNNGIVSGGTVYIPNYQFGVFTFPAGSPATSFSNIFIGTVANFDGTISNPIIQAYGSSLTMIWVTYDPTLSYLNQIYGSTNAGSGWSTPAIILDTLVTPAATVAGVDTTDIFALSLGTNLDGNPGIMISTWCLYYVPKLPINIACGLTPNGIVGKMYLSSVVVTGDIPPDTFSIISGALPTGLSINSTTGVISGTPTVVGTFTYTVQIVDSFSNTATCTCSILIKARPALGNIFF